MEIVFPPSVWMVFIIKEYTEETSTWKKTFSKEVMVSDCIGGWIFVSEAYNLDWGTGPCRQSSDTVGPDQF